MSQFEPLSQAIVKGNRKEATALVQQMIDAKVNPIDIVEKGLVPGMSIIGEKFKKNEIFVPEMLIAARAMKESMKLVEPLLMAAGVKPKYTAVIGTVAGDLHDIGKNLVAMMWKGANINVIDLGVNVTAEQFAAALREHKAQIAGLSALLTTTMCAMKDIVETIRKSAEIAGTKVIIGGAPVTDKFAKEIGADGFAPDAATAVDVAIRLMEA